MSVHGSTMLKYVEEAKFHIPTPPLCRCGTIRLVLYGASAVFFSLTNVFDLCIYNTTTSQTSLLLCLFNGLFPGQPG